jgi:hypothetical protein
MKTSWPERLAGLGKNKAYCNLIRRKKPIGSFCLPPAVGPNGLIQMNEQEWLTCKDPRRMLDTLHRKTSDRKMLLFACACCRRIWNDLVDKRSRQAVLVAERFADGLATAEEMEIAAEAAEAMWNMDQPDDPLPYAAAAYNVAIPMGWWGAAPAFVAPYEIILDATPDREAEKAWQSDTLRDLFGNPFRSITLQPYRQSWPGGSIPMLAKAIYEDRTFSHLPVLADALEEAGCDNSDILSHLRGGGEHVRGCWVLDLLTGNR